MTTAVAKKGLADVQRGLVAVAYANGNTHQAERELKQDGIKIAQKTLWSWSRRQYKEDYAAIRAEILPKVGAEVADEHMELARRQLALAGKLADELAAETHLLEPRDKATAMRNADVGSGIHTEKARDLAGDFETPAKHQGIREVLRALQAKGIVLPGMEEAIDAEVVEDDALESGD